MDTDELLREESPPLMESITLEVATDLIGYGTENLSS
jgi:hypothetical protein